MSDSQSTPTGSTIIPCLRYRDAPAAISWLCDTFGFKQHAVYSNADGSIAHAQLSCGTGGMLMLGSVTTDESGWSRQVRQPDEVGGVETQSAYIVVPDADAVYSRAKANGATIVSEIRDEEYGGRGFCCKDREGHLWSIGSYNPWAAADGH